MEKLSKKKNKEIGSRTWPNIEYMNRTKTNHKDGKLDLRYVIIYCGFFIVHNNTHVATVIENVTASPATGFSSQIPIIIANKSST